LKQSSAQGNEPEGQIVSDVLDELSGYVVTKGVHGSQSRDEPTSQSAGAGCGDPGLGSHDAHQRVRALPFHVRDWHRP
jgi:hypothetical protein